MSTYTESVAHLDWMLSLSRPELSEHLSKLPEATAAETARMLRRRMETVCPDRAAKRLEQAARGELDRDGVRMLVEHHWPGALIDNWQADLIGTILSARKTTVSQVAIKGCTKAGKGYATALAACLWYRVPGDAKVIILSQSHKHAHEVMFGEVLRQFKRMHNRAEADIGERRIKSNEQKFIVTTSPDAGEGISGGHGPATMFVFDEASSLPEEFWDLAQTQARVSVALSNPRTLTGWFRKLYPSGAEDANQRIEIAGGKVRGLFTVGGGQCLNVISGEQLIPDQIDRARYEGIMAHPNPRFRRVFGEGKFPEQDEDRQVIGWSWLDRHQRAWRADLPIECFALDVAASEDGDKTILAAGGVAGCLSLDELQDVDTMRVVGWVFRRAETLGIELKRGQHPVVVDMDGLGKGVGDRLSEQGCWVLDHRGNATSTVDPKTYANLRAETWGELGLRLNPRGPWPQEPWAIPRDGELEEELCAPEKIFGSDGFRWHLTPKTKPSPAYKGETLREKLGRSPDRGDTVTMLYRAVRELQRHGRRASARPLIVAAGQDEEAELSDFLQSIVDAGRAEYDR